MLCCGGSLLLPVWTTLKMGGGIECALDATNFPFFAFTQLGNWSIILMLLSWLRHWVGDPGDRGTNFVTAITCSCPAIHFPAMYNLQCHERPVPFIPCLCVRLKIPWVSKSVGLSFLILKLKYCYYGVKQQNKTNLKDACTEIVWKEDFESSVDG